MARRQYAVLGLGIFGSTVVKTLSEYGCDVLAIDKDIVCVERVAPFATQAVQADMTNIDQLRHIGIGDIDVAIVGTGSQLENSILAIMNLKELGVEYVVAKAKNKTYMHILEKIGADKVIRPEKEMGERVAKSLLSNNIVDLIDIDDRYSIVEIHIPETWANKTLLELNVRNRFGINIIGIRKEAKANLEFVSGPNYTFELNDHILVIADTEQLEKLDFFGKLKG